MVPSAVPCFLTSLPSPPTNPKPITRKPTSPSSSHLSPPPPLRGRRLLRCSGRRGVGDGPSRDPNAESVRAGRFGFRGDDDEDEEEEDGSFQRSRKRRWWSDDPSDGFEDEFDRFDDDDESLWDKLWIFKVFRSYGYMLPAIIASLLLATGPKAFLMALALPLGQSALSLAFEKVWGKGSKSTKYKAKRKPFVRSSSFRKQGQEETSGDYKGRQGYQSWVSAEDGVADKGSNSHVPSFGGWDELDRQRGSARRQSSTASGSPQAEPVKKGKLSKGGRYRDVPLFLRLLIAVFPFLGSWIRLL